ncbi:SMI1/KNR4 family protein [Flavobacterium hungaricum]|uniref:SMI1/KNR4 family protein n=1 Tax=Flavobacterium hungaricum TaxID=2082725 RepID=A0ABR9TPP7_9FLAO|nr:SMI1/KNR4 family protein [Flavobacterium hungaricum]MBE8727365.1 SMI1/KNR4 family protein [Flavobacterium hungaricum]
MITIHQKSDIVIPFDKIGDNCWDVKSKLIIESLAENWSNDLKDPISTAAIENLEKRLGTTLPYGLKTFYNTFGIADIGEELQKFDDIIWLKDIWEEDSPYGPEFTKEDKISLPHLISFSDYLGNGNMFCFHNETKEIYYYDHDTRPFITKMFDSIDDYIKGCLIFAQTDLFGEVKQQQVEEWTEDIIEDLFGKDIVKKWRY